MVEWHHEGRSCDGWRKPFAAGSKHPRGAIFVISVTQYNNMYGVSGVITTKIERQTMLQRKKARGKTSREISLGTTPTFIKRLGKVSCLVEEEKLHSKSTYCYWGGLSCNRIHSLSSFYLISVACGLVLLAGLTVTINPIINSGSYAMTPDSGGDTGDGEW